MDMDARSYALHSKSRVESFDSVDSFDVVSMDEAIEECIDMEEEEEMAAEDRDQQNDGEWEDLAATEEEEEKAEHDDDVHIQVDEGFENALEVALDSSAFGAAVVQLPKPLSSPRRRSAREALRDFYLARAKTSEESSRNFRSYEPTEFVEPVPIVPLRAPERYDVELFERVTREANEKKAREALRAFYAQRDAERTQRAAENRANERLVYHSQIGSSAFLAADSDSCISSMYWETTRFVVDSNNPQEASRASRVLST